MAAELKTAVKKPIPPNQLTNSYPFTRPSTVVWEYAKGAFSDLEMLNGIVIDPNCDRGYLMRLNEGVFHWSDQTINKLDNTNSQDK